MSFGAEREKGRQRHVRPAGQAAGSGSFRRSTRRIASVKSVKARSNRPASRWAMPRLAAGKGHSGASTSALPKSASASTDRPRRFRINARLL